MLVMLMTVVVSVVAHGVNTVSCCHLVRDHQALLINRTTNRADLQVLLDSSEEYMIGKEEARRIIDEVRDGVSRWKTIAHRLGIAKREIDLFQQVYR